MLYESYKRRPPRRPGRFRRWLARTLLLLVLLAVLLAGICAGLLYLLPTGLFAVEPQADLAPNPGLPSSPINILLMGVDAENEGMRRSDTMMIASIGNGRVRLISLLRDTVVDIPGVGSGRINTAYAYGGPELAVRTVNAAFGLNIMHYIVADYATLVRLVDAVGGIEADISAQEMEQININVRSVARQFRPLGYTYAPLTVFGDHTRLNGLQALGYARIRKLDSDFMRASRQRTVLRAVWTKLRQGFYNPVLLWNTCQAALEGLDSDLSAPMLLSLGLKAVGAGDLKALRVPVNDSYEDTGSKILLTDPEMNRRAIYELIYN